MIAIADLVIDKKYYYCDGQSTTCIIYKGQIERKNQDPPWWNTVGYTIWYQFEYDDGKGIEIIYRFLRYIMSEEDFVTTIEDIYQ